MHCLCFQSQSLYNPTHPSPAMAMFHSPTFDGALRSLSCTQSIGAKTVFVSTDSPDVLLELEENSPSGLTFIAERDEIRGTDITNANLMNNLRLNVTRWVRLFRRVISCCGALMFVHTIFMDFPARVALQTFHQSTNHPTNQPTNQPTPTHRYVAETRPYLSTISLSSLSFRYTLEAVRGVLLLSRTQALVATFSSNFGRLAYEIMLARAAEQEHRSEAHHPTAVSLDLPWFAFP